jgi:hypothetical protein
MGIQATLVVAIGRVPLAGQVGGEKTKIKKIIIKKKRPIGPLGMLGIVYAANNPTIRKERYYQQ